VPRRLKAAASPGYQRVSYDIAVPLTTDQKAHLEPLGDFLDTKSWDEAANRIGSMQQSHPLPGIRLRRR
jgi:hypothetical protein